MSQTKANTAPTPGTHEVAGTSRAVQADHPALSASRGTTPRRPHTRPAAEQTRANPAATEPRATWAPRVRVLPDIEGKKYLVVSGYATKPVDGHYPHISAWNIMRRFGLNPRECVKVDERQRDVIEALRSKLILVDDVGALRVTRGST
jgi:hypothetical protein